MTDNLNITPETALKTLYTNLYPSLSEEHLPTLDPTPLEETHIDFINNPTVSAARNKFLTSWKASVEIETSYQAELNKNSANTRSSTLLEEARKQRIKIQLIILIYTYILL